MIMLKITNIMLKYNIYCDILTLRIGKIFRKMEVRNCESIVPGEKAEIYTGVSVGE